MDEIKKLKEKVYRLQIDNEKNKEKIRRLQFLLGVEKEPWKKEPDFFQRIIWK